MADKDSPDQPEDKSSAHGADTGWRAMGYLLSGLITWGGAGFLIDKWLDLPGIGLLIGMLVGAGTGMYLLIKHMPNM
ncbi:AtpZ/AtpI family protein [Haloglycomyces albus]|uniref:AtpZ/AtpI family protein n=1 Tax=Haloglycomyces albus TaxID=526067 RepID=UPI00046CDA7B|nr:AtpZ/AtpI family protein [Haloglycomyces albus]